MYQNQNSLGAMARQMPTQAKGVPQGGPMSAGWTQPGQGATHAQSGWPTMPTQAQGSPMGGPMSQGWSQPGQMGQMPAPQMPDTAYATGQWGTMPGQGQMPAQAGKNPYLTGGLLGNAR